MERPVAQYTQELRETTVKQGGIERKVQYTVMVPRFISQKETVAVKECKFFQVTRDGKLETVETRDAAARLKKPTAVLTGEDAKLDPRHLELIKPGTLYLVIPPGRSSMPPLPREDKP